MPLKLGKHNIKTLNGPVSFHLLQPSDLESHEPTFALFGDIHKSVDVTKQGGIGIYDRRFMEHLNSLGKPIAFLVEETDVQPEFHRFALGPFEPPSSSREGNKKPDQRMSGIQDVNYVTNAQCYDPFKATTNIGADKVVYPLCIFKKNFIPFIIKDKEGSPVFKKCPPFQNIEFIFGDLRGIILNDPCYHYFYESMIDQVLYLFTDTKDIANVMRDLENVAKTGELTPREMLDQVEMIAVTAIEAPKDLYDVIFSLTWTEFSTLEQELKKYDHPDRMQWESHIRTFLSSGVYVDRDLIPEDKANALTTIKAAFGELKAFFEGEEHKFSEIATDETGLYIRQVCLSIGAMLTDINMLLRLYNAPRRPELVCGYMGKDHITKGLMYFLTQIRKSHGVEGNAILNEKGNHCLTFNTVVVL